MTRPVYLRMRERKHRRGNAVFIFLDTNPYANATWEEVLPLLSPEQLRFINTRQGWTDAQKLRQARDFAEENEAE